MHRTVPCPPRLTLRRLRGAILALTALTLTPSHAGAVSLQTLLTGRTLTVGAARFTDWELLSLDDTLSPAPDLTLIMVNPIDADPANPGIQFVGSSQLVVTDINAIDLHLRYRVAALGGGASFTGHALQMTGISFAGASGLALVSQSIADVDGGERGSGLAIADDETNLLQTADAGSFSPQAAVSVTMNVFLSGTAAADVVTLSTFTQHFAQNGPAFLSGDFNQDGRVDGADFLKWQRGQSPSPLSSADLMAVRNNFGAPQVPVAHPAPEPSRDSAGRRCGGGTYGTNSAANGALKARSNWWLYRRQQRRRLVEPPLRLGLLTG